MVALFFFSCKKKENFKDNGKIAITKAVYSAKAIAKEACIYGFPLATNYRSMSLYASGCIISGVCWRL